MIGILTIARYEITRRWVVWLVAFGLGALPLVFSPSGRFTVDGPRLAESLFTSSIVLSWIAAFVIGMSLVGKPLHDGRLSFYFARPMASHAIAAGKVLGGIALIVGMELALVALPLLRVRRAVEGPLTLEDSGFVWFAAVLAAVFLAVGLVVGILSRSRSRWFVVDALGGSLAVTAVIAMFTTLETRKAAIVRTHDYGVARSLLERVDTLLHDLLAAGVLVAFASVVVAIAIGRTDRDRVHRTLSFTLWPALTATALVGLAVAHWGIQ